MTTQAKPEKGKQVVVPLDDQQVRKYCLLALMICFNDDANLFDHEVRVSSLHKCWDKLLSQLAECKITADWQAQHQNSGRWATLDDTIISLIKDGSLKQGHPIGRDRISLNLKDGKKRIFKTASRRILRAMEKNFKEFVKDYFLA